MSENENRFLNDFDKSVKNLADSIAVNEPDDYVQDAIIKRFELCYELAWKTLKAHLEHMGIICASPRECFKHAKANDLLKDEMGWLHMIETRNILVHTYNAEKSREMIGGIRNKHFALLEMLYISLSNEFNEKQRRGDNDPG